MRLTREGRGVLGLETSRCHFRSSNGKDVLGSVVLFACALLAIPSLRSPGQGVQTGQPQQRGWRLSLSSLNSASSQQGLKQPPGM